MFMPHIISYNKTNLNNYTNKSAKTLKRQCLEVILLNWQENPIINEFVLNEDARFILDHLSTDLQFKIIVLYIHDEIYWRRAFKSRWPGKITPQKPIKLDYEIPNQFNKRFEKENGHNQSIIKLNTWKCFYMERHLQQLLEHLKPEQYDPEQMKDLIELCEDYVIRLKLNQLQAPMEHAKERIPLNAILPALPNLKQLAMCFKQTYVGDDFSWHILQTTQKDIENLAIGLNSCNLNVLRIVNTDITCDKVTKIAWNLLLNKNLFVLDFSHCKIADAGTTALCKLILDISSLQELSLMNNFIGIKGIEMLCFTLTKPEANLNKLDLSLNKFGANGSDFLASMLTKNKHLTHLNLSACGLTKDNAILLIYSLEINRTLLNLDLSNNAFNEEVGKLFLDLFTNAKNSSLNKLDLRMTQIPTYIVLDIEEFISEQNSSKKVKLLQMHQYNQNVIKLQDNDAHTTTSSVMGNEKEIESVIETESRFPLFHNDLATHLENVFQDYVRLQQQKDSLNRLNEEIKDIIDNQEEKEEVYDELNESINIDNHDIKPEDAS